MLTRSEQPEPVFGAAEVARWPAGTLDRLVRLGLLVETDPATSATCKGCEFDHVEPVQWVREPNSPPRAYVPCARGAVRLDPADLRRWVVRLPALAQFGAAAIGAAGDVVERVPGRIWKLGTVRLDNRVWVGFLAVGLTRADAATVVESVPELRAANALVFVPAVVPANVIWLADRVPVVMPLCDLLVLGANGLTADRVALASALPPATRPVSKAPARLFATPPDTDWDRVTLVVEEHHVRVRVGETAERFGFAEAGFEDRRAKGAPDEVWALLRTLARFRGVLGTGDVVGTKPHDLKQKVSVLRDRLRALLALETDPFHPTLKGRPYRTRFSIRSDEKGTFPTPPGATWDDVTVTEVAVGVVEIGVTSAARGVEYVRGEEDEDDGSGRWEATTDTGERNRRYALADLGLVGAADLTPAGTAFVALLRAGGRLARPAHNSDLIALGSALTHFFQIDAPPFSFDTKRRAWVAQFGASSLVPASDR